MRRKDGVLVTDTLGYLTKAELSRPCRATTRSPTDRLRGLESEAGKLSPATAGLSPPVWIGAIVPCQKGFRRSNRRWRDALRQTRLSKLPVSSEPTRRMLREFEYMIGIFVRRLAECFAVILNPIATMLLVNGHCKQSDTIPIVLNQNGSNGFVAAPDDAVRLLTDEG